MPNGDLLLLRPSSEMDIRVEAPGSKERRLLSDLAGLKTLEQLRAEFGSAVVDDALEQLHDLGLVEDAADDDRLPVQELHRFDRQLRYFSDVSSGQRSPSECQQTLRGAKVAVLGVGGLGGWSALALACVGIGEFWLVDGDRVEVSNLNRQILFDPTEAGRPKVECAAARLRSFDPAAEVRISERTLQSEADVAEFIAGCDVLIDAADWPPHDIEHWCNSACFAAGIPYITMSHFPPIARVGPLFVPGVTGCYACYEAAFLREFADLGIGLEQRRAKLNPAGSLGPACAMIGGQVAMEVLHLLTGLASPATQGQAHIYDLRTMDATRETVEPRTDCPICGPLLSHSGSGAA